MSIVAPYRELPRAPKRAAALPSAHRWSTPVALLFLTLLLTVPVVALAMQPFSDVATAVVACLAAFSAATYARIGFIR